MIWLAFDSLVQSAFTIVVPMPTVVLHKPKASHISAEVPEFTTGVSLDPISTEADATAAFKAMLCDSRNRGSSFISPLVGDDLRAHVLGQRRPWAQPRIGFAHTNVFDKPRSPVASILATVRGARTAQSAWPSPGKVLNSPFDFVSAPQEVLLFIGDMIRLTSWSGTNGTRLDASVVGRGLAHALKIGHVSREGLTERGEAHFRHLLLSAILLVQVRYFWFGLYEKPTNRDDVLGLVGQRVANLAADLPCLIGNYDISPKTFVKRHLPALPVHRRGRVQLTSDVIKVSLRILSAAVDINVKCKEVNTIVQSLDDAGEAQRKSCVCAIESWYVRAESGKLEYPQLPSSLIRKFTEHHLFPPVFARAIVDRIMIPNAVGEDSTAFGREGNDQVVFLRYASAALSHGAITREEFTPLIAKLIDPIRAGVCITSAVYEAVQHKIPGLGGRLAHLISDLTRPQQLRFEQRIEISDALRSSSFRYGAAQGACLLAQKGLLTRREVINIRVAIRSYRQYRTKSNKTQNSEWDFEYLPTLKKVQTTLAKFAKRGCL